MVDSCPPTNLITGELDSNIQPQNGQMRWGYYLHDKSKTSFLYSQHFGHKMYGFSRMLSSSDTYPELAQAPQAEGSVPQDCFSLDNNHKGGSPITHTSV